MQEQQRIKTAYAMESWFSFRGDMKQTYPGVSDLEASITY
jgi:hypothetical protein